MFHYQDQMVFCAIQYLYKMEDSEAQNDEILALKSIFDDTQIHVNNSSHPTVGCIYVKPEVPATFDIQANKDGQLHKFRVQHLSPIELHFNYPVNYPSEKPPNFTLVCKWLRRDQVFCILFSIFK